MSDGVFNIAKGAAAEKIRDGASNVVVLLLKANEAETALRDHEDAAALLGAAGNTEADATNYARKTGVTATVTVDHTNDRVDLDTADHLFSALGGASNNVLTKLVFGYSQGAGDANIVPLTHHDFAVTTDGTDVTAQVANFFRAA